MLAYWARLFFRECQPSLHRAALAHARELQPPGLRIRADFARKMPANEPYAPYHKRFAGNRPICPAWHCPVRPSVPASGGPAPVLAFRARRNRRIPQKCPSSPGFLPATERHSPHYRPTPGIRSRPAKGTPGRTCRAGKGPVRTRAGTAETALLRKNVPGHFPALLSARADIPASAAFLSARFRLRTALPAPSAPYYRPAPIMRPCTTGMHMFVRSRKPLLATANGVIFTHGRDPGCGPTGPDGRPQRPARSGTQDRADSAKMSRAEKTCYRA